MSNTDPHPIGRIRTFTGRLVNILAPVQEDVVIGDVAHALALICRFNGHTREFYSVAQHSVLMSRMFARLTDSGRNHSRYSLLHDGGEGYVCDMPRPLKHVPTMYAYRDFESEMQATVYRAFELDPRDVPVAVKAADDLLCHAEIRDLMNGGDPAHTVAAGLFPTIIPVGPQEAERMFLERYRELWP